MAERMFNVLFLCTDNSARSIIAESILRKDGAGRFRAFSAGSHPKGAVNPFALKELESIGYPTDDLRSKSWDEFAAPGAPVMDFAFTVCDTAAAETCPVWPGQPMTAHWGIEDPCSGRRNRCSEAGGVRIGDTLSQDSDFDLHKPADQKPRQDVVEREAARDRAT
jgi:arsenate reductase